MKRLIIALLAGGMVFGAVFGLAATLSVNGGTIQAGSDTDLVCDEDGLGVLGWGLETDDGLVYSVRISGIDTDCESNDLFVVITDDGVHVRDGVVHIDSSATDADGVSITLTDLGIINTTANPYPAVDITDIEVFIEGSVGG